MSGSPLKIYLLLMVLLAGKSAAAQSFGPGATASLDTAFGPGATASLDTALRPSGFHGLATSTDFSLSAGARNIDGVTQGPEDLMSTGSETPGFRVRRLSDLPISLSSSWIVDSDVELVDCGISLKFPLLKFFGTPPPILKIGFKPTILSGGSRLNLPEELFEYTFGFSKVLKLNDRWTLRTMLGVGFATDNHNTTGNAWQFRGGVFGVFQQNEQWQWSLGAFSLGRRDLPVLPAIGAVWTPSPMLRCDLIPPNPKINFLLCDDGNYQDWLYVGGGFAGNSWAFIDDQQINDLLTYRDWRIFAGWQSVPKPQDGVPYAKGRRYQMELGYVFYRQLEFNQELDQVKLENAFLFRIATTY